MLAIALGLASGISWGLGDFLGGLASRRAHAITVVALSQAAGLVLALLLLALTRPDVPSAEAYAVGIAGGACGALGLAAFYRGLAVGTMSLVAPISALGALLPLALDLAAGRSPGPLALAGMVVALAGAALAATAPGPASRAGLGLAVVAALGFGGFFVLLAESADGAGALWSLVAARTGSVPIALVGVAVLGAGLAVGRGVLPLVLGAGILDASANLMFAAGSQRGLVSVVAVLGSLYPVVTVALAALVLHERLGRLQAVGAAVALGGVVMIAAG
ncbi:MAG TPA: DMT family transporter [Miltoncostaeaceae bacterium]|nr:DMT family transporter [Miltoncostaeaceae bacterium]